MKQQGGKDFLACPDTLHSLDQQYYKICLHVRGQDDYISVRVEEIRKHLGLAFAMVKSLLLLLLSSLVDSPGTVLITDQTTTHTVTVTLTHTHSLSNHSQTSTPKSYKQQDDYYSRWLASMIRRFDLP